MRHERELKMVTSALALNDRYQLIVIFGAAADVDLLVGSAVGRAFGKDGDAVDVRWGESVDEGERSGTSQVRIIRLPEDERAARDLLQRLNVTRDTVAARGNLTLILSAPSGAESWVVDAAPDLWSVRTLSLELRQRPVPYESLLSWAADSEQRFLSKLDDDDKRARYSLGSYTFSYGIGGLAGQDSTRTLRVLRDRMESIRGYTGWRPWWVPQNDLAPYVADGTLECWMYQPPGAMLADPAHSDFWRASADGLLYLRRGLDEDSSPKLEPGSRFSRSLPIWRTGEALSHALQLASELSGPHAPVSFTARWEGLAGRSLTEWPSRKFDMPPTDSRTRTELVHSSVETSVPELENSLATVVSQLVRPLYDAFLDAPEPAYLEHHLDELRSRPAH